ncbi:hypothetical protein QP834_17350, partial [Enterococcus faecalis]|nr:hypothetical protein [Enterococcus faecalis]
ATGMGKLRAPSFSLGAIDHFPLWEWIVELFAWTSLIGIIGLITLRLVSGSGRKKEAEGETRTGQATSLASRFLGSTRW